MLRSRFIHSLFFTTFPYLLCFIFSFHASSFLPFSFSFSPLLFVCSFLTQQFCRTLNMSVSDTGSSVISMSCAPYSVQTCMSLRGERLYFDTHRFQLMGYVDEGSFIYNDQFKEKRLSSVDARERRWKHLQGRVGLGHSLPGLVQTRRLSALSQSEGMSYVWRPWSSHILPRSPI